ncbi:MAG TPA: hypothetical protein VKS21_10945 [Spirochaetota bacterium]|nr:hypothetical protein [Spirochaetota bacterium]
MEKNTEPSTASFKYLLELFIKVFSFILLLRFIFLNFITSVYNSFIPEAVYDLCFNFFNAALIIFAAALILFLLFFYIKKKGLDFYFFALPVVFFAMEILLHTFSQSSALYKAAWTAKLLALIAALLYFTIINYRKAFNENRKAYYLYTGIALTAGLLSVLLQKCRPMYLILTFQSHIILLTTSLFIMRSVLKSLLKEKVNILSFMISILPLLLATSILFLYSFNIKIYQSMFANNLYTNTYFNDYWYYIYYGILLFYILYNFYRRKISRSIPAVVFILVLSLNFADKLDYLLILIFTGVTHYYLSSPYKKKAASNKLQHETA